MCSKGDDVDADVIICLVPYTHSQTDLGLVLAVGLVNDLLCFRVFEHRVEEASYPYLLSALYEAYLGIRDRSQDDHLLTRAKGGPEVRYHTLNNPNSDGSVEAKGLDKGSRVELSTCLLNGFHHTVCKALGKHNC